MLLLLCSSFLFLIGASSAQNAHNADWMSGNHGVGFRIPGGVDFESCNYNTTDLVSQIQNNIPEITYIIVGLSSGESVYKIIIYVITLLRNR